MLIVVALIVWNEVHHGRRIKKLQERHATEWRNRERIDNIFHEMMLTEISSLNDDKNFYRTFYQEELFIKPVPSRIDLGPEPQFAFEPMEDPARRRVRFYMWDLLEITKEQYLDMKNQIRKAKGEDPEPLDDDQD